MSLFAFIATYADPSDGVPGGVDVFRLDSKSGGLTPVHTVSGLYGPSYLARHPALPILYASERVWSPDDWESGAVSMFAIDQETGVLSRVGRVRSGGKWPAHLSVHPGGGWLLLANPKTPGIASIRLSSDGLPGDVYDTVMLEGRGPNLKRQSKPYPHSIWTDRSGRFVLACDLGTDRIMTYRFDEARGSLDSTELPFIQVSSGAGARHLAFHPSNRFVCVVNELDSTLCLFAFDNESGAMEIVQTVYSPPEGFHAYNHGSHAVFHPSGRFLYSANRGHDSLSTFAVNREHGWLERVGNQPCLGSFPRNFALTPNARLLLAGNHKSGALVSFHVERDGAQLVPTGHSIRTSSPFCVEIVDL
jgi:6-phosphogluconolactonase